MATLRQLLLDISAEGEEEHLKRLKHLVGDEELENHFTRAQLERCTTMMDVFDKMVQMDYLSNTKMGTFKEHMALVFKNSPIKNKVEQLINMYENGRFCMNAGFSKTSEEPTQPRATSPTNSFSDLEFTALSVGSLPSMNAELPIRFSKAFDYAAGQIGKDWKIFARLACLDHSTTESIEQKQYPKEVGKQAYAAFKIWYYKQSKPSMTIFRKTLRSIPRNDIADDLKEMDKQAK